MVGIFFLPLAWVLTETFFSVFARAACAATLAYGGILVFSLGALLWLVAFSGYRAAMAICFWPRAYARAIGMFPAGGSSISSQCRRRSVLQTDEHLDRPRPYFFPIYSVLAIVVYGIFGLFLDVTPTGRFSTP